MLYFLSQKLLQWSAGTPWADRLSALRLFRYITFRSAGAAVTALALSWWLGPRIIAWLKELRFGQEYKDKAEAASDMTTRLLSKKGTPTMGGILIILALNVTTLLWARWTTFIELTLLSVIVLTALGFYDDYAKISRAERRRREIPRETLGPVRPGLVHRPLSLADAFHQQIDFRGHGSVLQAPRAYGCWLGPRAHLAHRRR